MRRERLPGRWDLLEESSDPWPGDADKVDGSASDYRELARSISDQVARLRSVAKGGNELVGEYAPELEKSSDDLADYLSRAEGRFRTVADELGRWGPELRHAQTRSRSMVEEAERLDTRIQADQPPSTPVDSADQAAVDADSRRSTRLGNATGELSTLVGQFRKLRSGVDHVASSVAKRIRSASDDSLKNRRFDGVRQWIRDHADLLKKIADVLTWIATAIVIAALIIGTGGLALAAILTAAALLVHTMLALNGDGSWADVALDALALATFGTGKLLTSGAKGALALREGMAAYKSTSALARTALAESSGLSKALVWATRSNPVFRTIESMSQGMSKFSAVLDAEYKGGLAARLVYGDKEAAGLARAISGAADRLGSGALLNGAQHLMDFTVPVWRASLGSDVALKLLNDADPFVFDYPGIEPWVDWKEEHTVHAAFTP